MGFRVAILDIRANDLEADQFRGLLSNDLGAIRIGQLLSDELCTAVLEGVAGVSFSDYDKVVYETGASRIGPSLNEHRVLGKSDSEYWLAAADGWAVWRRCGLGMTLHQMVLGVLSNSWDGRVRPADVNGKALYWGMLRRMTTGTYVHWDEVEAEQYRGIFGELTPGQLTINIYLAAPESGGELLIWPGRWCPSHEAARIGYGYQRTAVAPEEPQVRILPRKGDAVIFASSNYHMVTPVQAGDRVAFSFFMAIASNGDLIIWS